MTSFTIDNGQSADAGTTHASGRRPPLGICCKVLLFAIVCLTLAALPHQPAQAQDRGQNRKITIPKGVVLSKVQKQAMKAHVRQELRKRRKESDLAVGNRFGVMATANCIEGYVRDAKIRKSAPDVQITAERGVTCDANGCQGWQVEARRASDELFDIEIVLQCTQEDWVRIEPVKE